MSEQEKGEKSRKSGRGGKIAFAVCLVVIIVLLGVVIFLLFQGQDEEEPVRRNVVVNEDNVDEVLESLVENESVPAGYYEVTMNSTWNFASGDVPSENAYVENATTNTNPVYFDVVREDTGETIYESPILPVGTHLDEIALDSVLEAGTYDCLLTYHLLDEEEQDVSTLQITLKIVVAQ